MFTQISVAAPVADVSPPASERNTENDGQYFQDLKVIFFMFENVFLRNFCKNNCRLCSCCFVESDLTKERGSFCAHSKIMLQ